MSDQGERPSGVIRAVVTLMHPGLPLPHSAWRARHRSMLVVVAVLGVALAVTALVHRDVSALLLGAAPVLALGGLGLLEPTVGTRLASSAAVLAMAWGAAATVQVSDGRPEPQLLFYVTVGVATVYQQWAPLLTAAAFVLVHHVIVGGLRPELLYNDPAAARHPWLWALAHVGLLSLSGVLGLVVWRSDERIRAQLAAEGRRTDQLMRSLGDGLVAVDAAGRIVRLNPAAEALLGDAWSQGTSGGEGLIGRDVRDVLPGIDAEFALVLAPGAVHDPIRVGGTPHRWTGSTGTAVPVEVTVMPTRLVGGVAAVMTLRDLTNEVRAEEAERRLATSVQMEATGRRDVASLQEAMRPDRLSVGGVSIGVTYEPAQSSPAGGDHYDWFELPDGTLQITVVDVLGRGIGATRQALAVVSTLRTLTFCGVPLEGLIAAAEDVLAASEPLVVATVVVVRYDPSTGQARVVTAGHPPALRVHRGTSSYLETEGVPLGYPSAGSVGDAVCTLVEGDLLVLCSDGVLEGTRDLGAGLEALADGAAKLWDRPPQEVADTLLSELSTVAHDEDDCLILVLQRTPSAESGDLDEPGHPVVAEASSVAADEWHFGPELGSARLVRRHTTAFAENCNLDPAVADTLVLVVSELVSNAIAHAETAFRLRLSVVDGQVRGSVRDGSTQEPVVHQGRADGVNGRGLIIVDRSTRAWGFDVGPEGLGKTVWFTLDATIPDALPR